MQRELGYLAVAAAASALALAPGGVHDFPLDPRLVPLTACFAALWSGVRLGRFAAACNRRRRWRRSPDWAFEAVDLPFESAARRLPRGLAWRLYRLLFTEAPPGGSIRLRNWLAAVLWYRPWLSGCASRWLGGRVYPDRGIFLGRAFRWSRRHTQELEDYLHASASSLPTGRGGRGGYPALHAVGQQDEQALVLPWSELVGHVLVGGTTRSGKTRLLEVILCEAIRGPGTVIVMDPKGDRELLVRTASEARRMGRPFAFFSPAFPAVSASFNPFSACENTTELAERVQVLMPGGGRMTNDPFFIEYPLAFVQHIGDAQQALAEDWTIERLNTLTTLEPPFERLIGRYLNEVILGGGRDSETLEKLVEAYDALAPEERSAMAPERLLVADKLVEARRMEREHFQKVTANLVPAFRGVTGGDLDRLLSCEAPDLTWEGIVSDRIVVYFSMNSLMYGEVANRIGRVILQDLIGFLGRRYAYDGGADMTPLTVLIDEFSNVAYGGFIDALNKGGGAKAQFMLAMQSLADPEAAMGRDGTQRVLDNLNTRVWFRLTDDATAKLATEGPGPDEHRARRREPQPELRRGTGHLGRGARRHGLRRAAAGAPGMGDGAAARRGVRAHAGRELEAAGSDAGAGGQEGTARHHRSIRAARGVGRTAHGETPGPHKTHGAVSLAVPVAVPAAARERGGERVGAATAPGGGCGFVAVCSADTVSEAPPLGGGVPAAARPRGTGGGAADGRED